jgi:putative transposase
VPTEACAEDLLLCRLIDEEYTSWPFYGSRRMVAFLKGAGHVVNRKRVQCLIPGRGGRLVQREGAVLAA